MSSYQASVELDFKQESSNSTLWETAEVIVEYDCKSAILAESTHLTQEPGAPDMNEPSADENLDSGIQLKRTRGRTEEPCVTK